MPEVAFGRRGRAPVAPPDEPFAAPAPIRDAEHLGVTARRFRLAGELLAYAGMLVALVTSIEAALAPLDITMSKIYVPTILEAAMDFTSPSVRSGAGTMLPMVGSAAWPLLLLFGVIAIIRGRWLLAGLCAATFAFPWTVLGVYLPFGAVALVMLGGLTALKLYRPRGLKLFVTIILALIVGPVITGVAVGIAERIVNPTGIAEEKYRVIEFADLAANAGLPGNEVSATGKPIVRVSTLANLTVTTPIEQGALAFALAQEMTIRKDVAGAVAALERIEGSAFVPNAFEARRLTVARNFATTMGAYGEAARLAFEARASTAATIGSVSLYAALALALLGPLADVLGTRIGRRRVRIEAAAEALALQRAGRSGASRVGRMLGETGAPQLQSIAALDGDATLDAIDRRLRLYRILAFSLGVAAIFAVGAGALMWLPPAASNTAFSQIALAGDAVRWARDAGLPIVQGPMPLDATISMLALPVLIGIGATFIFFRRFAVYAAGAALAAVLFWQVASLFFVDTAYYEAPAAAFTPAMRSELERAASAAVAAAPGRTVPGRFADIGKTPSSTLPTRPFAAYLLAQLDYMEGRANSVGRWLETVSEQPRALDVLSHEQRFDIMREWSGVNGYPVETGIAGLNMIGPMSLPRAASLPATIIGILAGTGAIAALCAMPIASNRRRRIEELIGRIDRRRSSSS